MQTSLLLSSTISPPSEGIVLFFYEDNPTTAGSFPFADASLVGILTEFIEKHGDFGKKHKCWELHTHGKIPATYIFMVGLGKAASLDGETLRGAGAVAAKRALVLKLKSLSITPPKSHLEITDMLSAIAEGALSAMYSFDCYKTESSQKKKDSLEVISFLTDDTKETQRLSQMLEETRTLMESVFFARDLVNTPSNDLTPAKLAQEAKNLAGGKLQIAVWDAEKILAQGMSALYSVGKGSQNEPRFIIMNYAGGKEGTAPIVLVGKGLTFDSGGISIKPAENMGEMKGDMAGAATVIATLSALNKLGVAKNVVGLVAALENMPDGNSYKPGDIITSLAGHTIEITNTDAEGRVALADALAYAQRYQPELIIDIATLTGACSIAVGRDLIALMGNSEQHSEALKKVAAATGEPVWELPLWEGYQSLIESKVADVVNSAGREAGTITAGLFLAKFVGDYPWLHLDIASTSWSSKDKLYIPAGATGIGVRLLTKLIKG